MNEEIDVLETLRSKNINPSVQRVQILNYLLEHRDHPTVETIHSDLKNTIAAFSKTTVYNTMKIFMEKGIVSELLIHENESRFDINTSSHGHFRCLKCGIVEDFKIENLSTEIDSNTNYEIATREVSFSGICKNCK